MGGITGFPLCAGVREDEAGDLGVKGDSWICGARWEC